jgi:hypothetical protein
MADSHSAPFSGSQSWSEKTFQADKIWQQVKDALAKTGATLAPTPRRPDVRLIVNNISGGDITFQNPGQHADKPEVIPASGSDTAAMIMLAGETLSDQHLHAFDLYNRFNLAAKGLTAAFAAFVQTPEAKEFLNEAYGPAPFEAQSKKLVQVDWTPLRRPMTSVTPVFGAACSFGARAATSDNAFLATVNIYVEGTKTAPERMENRGMVIAVTFGNEGGEDKTRPIAPSVAEEFYGIHFDKVPLVILDVDGRLQRIDLKNNSTIHINPQNGAATLYRQAETGLFTPAV